MTRKTDAFPQSPVLSNTLLFFARCVLHGYCSALCFSTIATMILFCGFDLCVNDSRGS